MFVDPRQIEEIVRATWDAWSPLIALHDSPLSAESPGFVPDSLHYTSTAVRNDPRFDPIDEAGLITVLRKITP